MAFLAPYIIVGCWGRNQQQPYPTAPEAKILMEASSSGLSRESHSHPNLPLCSSPLLQELAEQMGFVPWLASIPVLALEPARQQKGSGEPLLPPCRLSLSWQNLKFTEHLLWALSTGHGRRRCSSKGSSSPAQLLPSQ